MTSHRTTLRLAALLLVFGIACDSPGGVAAPPIIPGLGAVVPGTWYMHAANGTNLPAMISERLIGVSPEQTFLDSARLVIDPDGSYQQRYWIRILINSSLDREDVVLDQGFWTSFGDDNRFRSFVRERMLTVGFPTTDRVQSTEQMLYWSGAPIVSGLYRLTRP